MENNEIHTVDEILSTCPITGLRVISRPEWQVAVPHRNYKADISILGCQILKAEIHGYSTRQESRKTAQVFDSIIPEYFDETQGFVQIFDMMESTGFSLASRKNYKRAIERRKGVLGHIFYNTNMLFNLSVRLGRKLNQLGFGVHIVNDYKEAVALAERLIAIQIPASNQFQMDTTLKPFTAFETSEYCPISGLPVGSKPEWTQVDFGNGYSGTFKIIGTSILLTDPCGSAGFDVFERFFQMRAQVIQEAFGPDKPFFEIKDYETTRTPPKNLRRLFLEQMISEKNRMVGFIAYNAPVGVKFSFNVGKRLVHPTCPVLVVPSYEKAIRMAISAMDYNGRTGLIPPPNFFSKNLSSNPQERSYSSYQINHCVNELLHFLGNINWEIDGLDSTMEKIPPAHPFSTVFEAIALIKSDLDNLSRERRNAVNALLKSEKLHRLLAENAMEASETLQKTQEQLIQSEKMAALGSLVAGVSHEISTPLGISVTASSFLHQKTTDFERKKKECSLSEKDIETYVNLALESTSLISNNLNRASELINSFKQISVDQSNEMKRRFNLNNYTQIVLKSLNPRLKRTGYSIRLECPEQIMVESFPGALSQILTNLVMNSLVHGFEEQDKGDILVRMWEIPHILFIEYIDNGVGMDEETLKHMYDPFFTTKRASGGTGLGMHIVYNIVTGKLKGQITCISSPGQGTRFLIQLPH